MYKTSSSFQREKKDQPESGLVSVGMRFNAPCSPRPLSRGNGFIKNYFINDKLSVKLLQILLAIFYLILVFSGWIFQSSLAFWQVVSHVLAMMLLAAVFVFFLKLVQKVLQNFLTKQDFLTKERKEQGQLKQEKKNRANNFELFMLFCMALIVYPGNLVYLYRWGAKESLLEVGLAQMNLTQVGGLIWRKFGLWQYWRVPVLTLIVLVLIIILFQLVKRLLSQSVCRQNKKYLLGKKRLLCMGLVGLKAQNAYFKIKDKLKINFFSLISVAAAALIILVFCCGNSTYQITKQWQNPLIAWQEICLAFPQDVQAWQIYASLLAEANCLIEAKSAYLHILQFNPSNIEALTAIGQLMFRENRDAEANHYFIQALRVKADYWPAQEGIRKIKRL